MADPSVTSLGRVQPIYKGEWSSEIEYNKLDNVFYQGNSYISRVSGNIGNIPPTLSPFYSNYWGILAKKGDTGDTGAMGPDGPQGATGSAAGFGTPSISVVTLSNTEEATASIIASGSDTSKVFSFSFGIPRGAPGSGSVSTVDSIEPDSLTGNVALGAVRYNIAQSLNENQKARARQNIGAAASGDYIASPSNISTGQFLQYSNEGDWVGANINLVPTGAVADVGKFLRKTSTGMVWAAVQALPAGGSEEAPLIKNSIDNYDVTWGSVITTSDIDAMFEE